jgi:hypothetical protein
MELDPNKLYAELAPFTNLVARVFPGEEIPDWSLVLDRKIIEIPAGVVVQVGDRYNDGQFSPVPAPLSTKSTGCGSCSSSTSTRRTDSGLWRENSQSRRAFIGTL